MAGTKYISDNFQPAVDSFIKLIPLLSFDNKGIFLTGTTGNMSVVLKLDVEVTFRCFESLASEALQYDIKDGKFSASLEKEYNRIFNNASVDLGNFSDSSASFGLKFHTLGLNYSISCKPVLITGLVNVFEAAGKLSRSVKMEILGHEFAVEISSGYEAVIEVRQNMPSATLLPIPGLVNALSSNQIHIKPVTVDNLNRGNVNSSNVFSRVPQSNLIQDSNLLHDTEKLNGSSNFLGGIDLRLCTNGRTLLGQ